MYDQNILQTSIEMWFSAFSLIAAACLVVGREEKTKACKQLVVLQLANALYMSAEGLAYFFSGNTSEIGYWGVRITNHVAYVGQFIMLAATTFYIRAIILDNDSSGKKHLWHIPMLVLVTAALALMAINPSIPIFFYINEVNEYVRADYFYVSQVLGLIMIIYPLIMLYIHRKKVSKTTVMAVYIFALSPLVAMVYQYFHYGLSFTGFATTASVLLLFVTYELEVAHKLEIQNKKKLEEMIYKQ